MINVVIVAGGLGSRLSPLTNYIPKFLVNIGKNTGYVEQVRYWEKYANFHIVEEVQNEMHGAGVLPEEFLSSLTVIVHSAYADLIKAYHSMYFPKVPLIVKTVDVANGSAHAILSSCDHLVGKPVFFQWCDVMPGEGIPATEMDEHYHGKNAVFTNYDHPNRYGLEKREGRPGVFPQLREDGRGGIFGLYYVSRFKTDIKYEDGQDFVEVLEQYGELREHQVRSIVDWGDKPKLERTRSTADAAREFNKVEFHGDLVLKAALNDQGKSLIAREIKWYQELVGTTVNVQRPTCWPHPSGSSFVMSRVEGAPVFTFWPHLDSENRGLVLERIFDQMGELHRIPMAGEQSLLKDLHRDVKIEAHDKLLSRFAEIENVVKAFGDVHTVNGWVLSETDPRKLISKLHEELAAQYNEDDKYVMIHGDMQMSNAMINPDTMEVSLIDPRGYFGKSEIYGLADYDIAKMYYSLSGYDIFNYSRDFGITSLKDGAIEFAIPKPELDGCEQLIAEKFKYKHNLWLAVIWLGLAGYIKNDPVKSVCAHYHGMAMAEKALAKLDKIF